MNRTMMAMGLAGVIGAAGLLAPGLASAHGRGGDGRGTCWGDDGGGHGRRGMRGMMGDGGGMMMGGGVHGGGLGPVWRLDLNDAQRKQVTRISDDLRRAHWATMGKMLDARAKLRDLQAGPQPDPKQVGAAFAEVSKLRQEMVEASVRARNDARAVLTPEQRKQLDAWRAGDGRGPMGHGPMGHGRGGPAADDDAGGEL